MTTSCSQDYNDARTTFETVLYSSCAAWLFLTVIFVPRNEARDREQRQRCCGFLVPCLRTLTGCLEPCRPLLDNDEEKATDAAKNAGTCGSVCYLMSMLTVQALPLLALIVGISLYYPSCPCQDPGDCKCTFSIDFVPVGSCTAWAIIFASLSTLGGMAFAMNAMRALRIVRSASSYSTVRGIGDGFEQEVV